MPPTIEVLWWEGCPSTERAVDELREALAELGLDGAEVVRREIRTDEEAAAARFSGSPTVLVNGADVVTPPAGEPMGLTCRVYRRRDGRISPTPDPEDVRDALRAATRREQETT